MQLISRALEGNETVADQAVEKPIRKYDLFVTYTNGIKMRLNDEGVSPTADGIEAMRSGRWVSLPYADIRGINLSTAEMAKSALIATCQITFRNGSFLRVINTNAWGTGDPLRNGDYQAFVEDLHRRLVAANADSQIDFTIGMSATRSRVLKVALIAGSALFVALPIVLFVMTGKFQALLLCLAGFAFLAPALRTAEKNQQRSYSPKAPPNLF